MNKTAETERLTLKILKCRMRLRCRLEYPIKAFAFIHENSDLLLLIYCRVKITVQLIDAFSARDLSIVVEDW